MIFTPCNFPHCTLIPNYFQQFSIHLLGCPCRSPHSHLHNVCKLPTASDISLYRSHLLHHSKSPNSPMKPPLSGQHPTLTLPLFSACTHLVTPKLTEKKPPLWEIDANLHGGLLATWQPHHDGACTFLPIPRPVHPFAPTLDPIDAAFSENLTYQPAHLFPIFCISLSDSILSFFIFWKCSKISYFKICFLPCLSRVTIHFLPLQGHNS